MAITTTNITRFDKGQLIEKEDHVLDEKPLEIIINNVSYTTTMRTPKDDLELARGLLYIENMFRGTSDEFNYVLKQDTYIDQIQLYIDESLILCELKPQRSTISVSSCGICGIDSFKFDDIDPLKTDLKLNATHVEKMFSDMKNAQTRFDQTGGSHASGLFNQTYELLSLKEDIGRHNAVDKVIGDILYKEQLNDVSFMLVSGRTSYEIVSKCYQSNIPFLIAVSSPSNLAIEMAEKMGITLIGFSRGNRFNCYSHPERIHV